MDKRGLSAVAGAMVLAGSLLVGPTASAATAVSYGPYRTLAECRAVQDIVRPFADRLTACTSYPKRGYFFTAYRD